MLAFKPGSRSLPLTSDPCARPGTSSATEWTCLGADAQRFLYLIQGKPIDRRRTTYSDLCAHKRPRRAAMARPRSRPRLPFPPPSTLNVHGYFQRGALQARTSALTPRFSPTRPTHCHPQQSFIHECSSVNLDHSTSPPTRVPEPGSRTFALAPFFGRLSIAGVRPITHCCLSAYSHSCLY